MLYLIRGTVLSGAGDLIAELGGDPDALLRAHNVDPVATEDFERFIRYADAAAVFGDAARLLDCPDFGMRLARRQGIQILGPIGVILRNAATVGDAVDGVCRFLHNIVPVDTAELIRTQRAAVYSYATIIQNDFDRHQMVEKSLTLAMSAFCSMLGDDFVPLRVTFQHRRMAPLGRYQEVFRRPIEFEAERNAIHLPLPALRRPIRDRDAAALALAENYLTRIRPDLAMADRVREVTRRLLIVNQASLVEVARAISLHPRVVQRRLADEGTTFEQILDDVRRAAAWELSATGIQVSQIARALGYYQQSSYARACRRWYGESPRQLRARRRGQGPSSPPDPGFSS
ncbi:AraC family transcriptional regulator [Nocardia pseudovaccinii]|uniref:AraC family transcriptional regulator n=1 Tax=Nocardia pseudovaccinii TaxID=189540 RepID=UPI0007A3E20D|nr:AraC family transcriptional regulator [Nocardia pseudovaccinii]